MPLRHLWLSMSPLMGEVKWIITREQISITYSVFAFVALGIEHLMRMRHIVICTLPCSTIFFHIIS